MYFCPAIKLATVADYRGHLVYLRN